VIDLQNVGKRFGGKHRTAPLIALHDVTLSIPAGSTWGVVGPNGAGKSTLFALLLGFLKPSNGAIRIAGLEPRDYMRQQGAGYLPERFSLPAGWPVRAALEALAALENIARPVERADEVLNQFGLQEHAEKSTETLSRGLLQRVGLAQALMAQRQLIVLDEPTEGLDPIWRLHFRERIRELPANTTLLMASHDLAEIERLVDHAIVLDKGAIRESFAIASPSGPRKYRVVLETPLAAARTVFDQIELADGDGAFTVTVNDARELSTRLSALLALGAVVHSIQPADGLEERVRATFREADR